MMAMSIKYWLATFSWQVLRRFAFLRVLRLSHIGFFLLAQKLGCHVALKNRKFSRQELRNLLLFIFVLLFYFLHEEVFECFHEPLSECFWRRRLSRCAIRVYPRTTIMVLPVLKVISLVEDLLNLLDLAAQREVLVAHSLVPLVNQGVDLAELLLTQLVRTEAHLISTVASIASISMVMIIHFLRDSLLLEIAICVSLN